MNVILAQLLGMVGVDRVWPDRPGLIVTEQVFPMTIKDILSVAPSQTFKGIPVSLFLPFFIHSITKHCWF